MVCPVSAKGVLGKKNPTTLQENPLNAQMRLPWVADAVIEATKLVTNDRWAVVAERRRTAASPSPTRGCLAPPLADTPSSSHAPCRRPPTPLHAASSPGTAAPTPVKCAAGEPLEETALPSLLCSIL